MSIYAYVGLPGSGKSYSVVANQIVPALEKGRKVVTNVPLVAEEIRKICPFGEFIDFPVDAIKMEPQRILEYCTPGSLVVIDELWQLFPAGLKANQVPDVFKSFLAEHRHKVNKAGDSTQIVFVTQDLAQIAAFARQLVEQTYHHNKLTQVGQSNKYRVDIYHGAVTGNQPSRKGFLRSIYGTYKKTVFPLYKSHTQSESDGHGANEQSLDGRGNVLKRPAIILGALFAIGCVIFAASALSSIFASDDQPETPLASVATERRSALPLPEKLPSTQASPMQQVLPAPDWYLVGFIDTGHPDTSYGLVSIDSKVVRVPYTDCWVPVTNRMVCALDGYAVTSLGSDPL